MTSKDSNTTPTNYTDEKWRPIPGHDSRYRISNYGRCKIVEPNEFIINPISAGWQGKYLAYSIAGKREYAHRAVLFSFIGNPPDDTYQCNHKDGDKHNNHLDNLEWVTPRENQQHRYNELGQSQNGVLNPANKYSREQIQKILDLYATGKHTQRKIAEIVGIDYRYVHQIVHGRAWKHLQD